MGFAKQLASCRAPRHARQRLNRRGNIARPKSIGFRAISVGTFVSAVAVLCSAALLNGYPLVFSDTGSYLSGAITFEIAFDRPIFYGIFIAILQPGRLGLWTVVAAQSAIVAFVLRATLASFLGPRHDMALVPVAAGLSVLTALPWVGGQVTPDIFAPLTVLTLYLLAFRPAPLGRAATAGLAIVLFLSVTVHLSHLLLAAALLLPLIGWRHLTKAGASYRLGLAGPAAIAVAGLLASPAVNYTLTGEAVVSRAGPIFVLGRLLDDGIVTSLLSEICPSPEFRLCEFRDSLNPSGDDFLWGDSPAFAAMGGWSRGQDEALRIIGRSLVLYPFDHLRAAAEATWNQLTHFATGDGIVPNLRSPHVNIAHLLLDELAAFEGARQQAGRLDFGELNLWHVPLAGAAMLLCIVAAGLPERLRGMRPFLLFVMSALAANAFICGVLSGPHDRYQARVVWLAVLGAGLALWPWRQRPGHEA